MRTASGRVRRRGYVVRRRTAADGPGGLGSVAGQARRLEVHILDFDHGLYGETLEVEFEWSSHEDVERRYGADYFNRLR